MCVSHSRRPFPAVVALFVSALAAARLLPAAASSSVSRQVLLDQYCTGCHNDKSKTGGIALQNAGASNPAGRSDLWEKVVRKLNAGEMPPPGLPRPDAATLEAFAEGLVSDLDTAARANPYAGRPVIRRLNRLEYANAIRDLLEIELPVRDELPPDGIAAGFDNIGDALSMSPLLLEQYLKVARRVSEHAVGASDPSPVTEIFRAPDAQSAWLGPGMPFGTRGGIRVQHYFQHDGEYSLRAFLERNDLPKLEGVRFFQTRVKVKAGPHVVIATFPDESAEREGPVPNVAGPGGTALGRAAGYTRFGDSPHARIARRQSPREGLRDRRLHGGRGGVRGDAGSADHGPPGDFRPVQRQGRRRHAEPAAHLCLQAERSGGRGRLCVEDPQHDRRKSVPPRRHCRGGQALSRAVTRRRGASMISMRRLRRESPACSSLPIFCSALNSTRPRRRRGACRPCLRLELASRLSFFLWSSIPDDELLAAARTGKLRGGRTAGAGAPHARRPRRRHDGRQLRRAMARAAWTGRCQARSTGLSRLRCGAGRRLRTRDATLRAQFRPGESQRARSAARRTTPISTSGWLALWDPWRDRAGLPPRSPHRRAGARRTARPGQHPAADVARHQDVAGPPRQVDSGQPANSPPPPPPPGVPAIEESAGEGRKADDAATNRAAPEGPRLRIVPCPHGSAGVCAREFRRDRQLADPRRRRRNRPSRASCPTEQGFTALRG